MNILTLSRIFPNSQQPTLGLFVYRRLKALIQLGHRAQVIAPVPIVPPFIKKLSHYSKIPYFEEFDGIPVYHPRYIPARSYFRFFSDYLLYPCIEKCFLEIRKAFSPDIIDSHFVYPMGASAARLGKKFTVPVSITARGILVKEITHVGVRKKVARALQNADSLIAVSNSLSLTIKDLIHTKSQIAVIPNGVNQSIFTNKNMAECREKLGIPLDAKVILSIGYFTKNKGFHLLIESLEHIKAKEDSKVILIIVGGSSGFNDHTRQIRKRSKHLPPSCKIMFPGFIKDPHRLLDYYNSCDLFALCSQSEGCPNVVLEAISCHRPVVLTNAQGCVDLIGNEKVGTIVDRNPIAIASGIDTVLSTPMDQWHFKPFLEYRTWNHTAQKVIDHWQNGLS